MEMTDKRTSNLYYILENLVENLDISDQELSTTMIHIFESGPKPYYISNNDELSEQVRFLRQLVEDRDYKTVEDLENHFDDLCSWAEGLGENPVEAAYGSGKIFISFNWENHINIKELKDFLNEGFSDKLIFTDKSTMLYDVWTSIIERLSENLTYHKREDVRFVDMSTQATELSKLLFVRDFEKLDKIAGPGFEAYLKQFVAHNLQETFIQFTQKPEIVKRLPFYKSKLLLLDDCYYSPAATWDIHNFENILELSYDKIMNIVTFEKDINSDILKKSLGIWMAYSKFRCVSFSNNDDDVLEYITEDARKCKDSEDSYQQFSSWYKPLIEILLEKKWKILKSPTRHSWITTENPGISIFDLGAQEFMHIRPDILWRSIRKDSLEYFPLSGSYCLRLEPFDIDHRFPDDKYGVIEFTHTTEKEVNVVNALARRTNPIALISSSKRELKKEVVLKRKVRTKYSPKYKKWKSNKAKSMYVKRLEVENIRSFKNLDIELSKGITLIAGENNAGKSTVLKSIYLLQEPYTFRDQDLRVNTPDSAIRITLADISEKNAFLFQDHSKGAAILPTMSFAEVLFPRTIQISNDAYYVNTQTNYNHSLKELTLDQRRERYKDKFPYFPNFENKGNFIYPFFAKRRGGFLLSSAKDNAYHVSDDYKNLPTKVQKVSNQRVTKERFATLCKEILGFEVGVYQGENGENRIAVHVGYSDRIPLESMGEGTANILGLITLLLTENDKLFLLEELENDIHPLALKKLLALIIEKSSNNQFVISTHSNIILKYLGAEKETKIFFTEWNFDREKTGEDLPTSYISEITNSPEKRLEILERLGYELFDYDLYKGYIIFEESSAEKIILDFIIPIFVPELKGKIKTVAAQGVNDVIPKLHTLSSLFMYLHRNEIYRNKAWVIVDGDEEGKKVINDLKKRYSSWNEDHFLCFKHPNFEMYYPDLFKDEVTEVLKLKNGPPKQNAKKNLLQNVLSWISQNPEEALDKFQQSAAEIIMKLEVIAEIFKIK